MIFPRRPWNAWILEDTTTVQLVATLQGQISTTVIYVKRLTANSMARRVAELKSRTRRTARCDIFIGVVVYMKRANAVNDVGLDTSVLLRRHSAQLAPNQYMPVPHNGWNIVYNITGSNAINSNYNVSAIGRDAHLFVPYVLGFMSTHSPLRIQRSFGSLTGEQSVKNCKRAGTCASHNRDSQPSTRPR